jgi:hypothetical protein
MIRVDRTGAWASRDGGTDPFVGNDELRPFLVPDANEAIDSFSHPEALGVT